MVTSKFKFFGIGLVAVLAVVSVAFVCFKLARPPNGHIDIRYDGPSTSGIIWKLENRSNQTIYLQGTGDKVWPNVPVTKCKQNSYSPIDSDLPYLADGFPSIIKVSPNRDFRFTVETSLPQKYKGGHCYIRLRLLGGTFVESEEFTPK
jgi:hypothetical protein